MSDAPVRFSRVLIEGLFDADAPPIDIRFNLEERVTILHGRNGSGKTITLSLLDALLRGELHMLTRVPFEHMVVEMTNGSSMTFERSRQPPNASDEQRQRQTSTSVRYRATNGDALVTGVIRPLDENTLLEAGFDITPDGRWHSYGVTPHEGLSTEHALDLYVSQAKPRLLARLAQYHGYAPLLAHLKKPSPVKFVKTDRLFAPPRRPDDGFTDSLGNPFPIRELMVEQLSQDIREHVEAADKQYRLTATQLDNALRHRLVDPTTKTDITLDELKQRYAALAEEEARLRDLGLLQEASQPVRPESFTEQNRTVLAILLEDNEKKLEPFRKLADRAQRLLTTLNRKLAPKSVKLNVETGYHVAAADGRPLPLDKLSSGEQHELVLLHELLFEAAPGSLILIDEPELSLHPTWQAEFLPDVLAIAELSDLDFVLATHSPYIIGDRSDLMVRLGAPVDERA